MKKYYILPLLLACTTNAQAKSTDEILNQNLTAAETGYQIMREADDRDAGYGDQSASIKMVLIDAQGEKAIREMETKTLEVPSRDEGDKSLTVFYEPRDIRGSALLTHAHVKEDDDQWLYLPRPKIVKRISSANKSGPFMNSEFSYEDIIPAEISKYSYTYKGETTCGPNLSCVEIDRFPKYDNSGYTKQTLWVDKEELRIWKIVSYDRKSSKLKTMTVENFKQYLGKYWRPTLTVMVNHQTGKGTELHWNDIQFQTGLNDNHFTKAKLKRSR